MEEPVLRTLKFAAALIAATTLAAPAFAWQPTKAIEFIATAGPGGGTDNFARAIDEGNYRSSRLRIVVPGLIVVLLGSASLVWLLW